MINLIRALAPLLLGGTIVAPNALAAQDQSIAPDAFRGPAGISTYRIKSGDQIQIYVWGEERLQREMRVLPDGTIAFPLVGQVAVADRLPQEVEVLIRNGLASQYRGEVPQVTVSVVSPAPTQFTVLGKVATPGTFETNRQINVLEALSLAGGGTEFASLDRIVLLRKDAGGLAPIEVNLKPLLRGRIDAAALQQANLVQIEAGDTIIVP